MTSFLIAVHAFFRIVKIVGRPAASFHAIYMNARFAVYAQTSVSTVELGEVSIFHIYVTSIIT